MSKENTIKAQILLIIADELSKGAAGPCDYWYKILAKRLVDRAQELSERDE